jgi:hypothetical protein
MKRTLVLLVIVSLLLAGCGFYSPSNDKDFYNPPSSNPNNPQYVSPPSSGPSSTHTIKYVIVGSASSGSITYTNAQGGTEQMDVQLPFSKTFEMQPGSFVYISVQNQSDSGNVICAIDVDGIEVRTSTSTAAYGIATCSGRL